MRVLYCGGSLCCESVIGACAVARYSTLSPGEGMARWTMDARFFVLFTFAIHLLAIPSQSSSIDWFTVRCSVGFRLCPGGKTAHGIDIGTVPSCTAQLLFSHRGGF